jgi:penicillin-binding protein 2
VDVYTKRKYLIIGIFCAAAITIVLRLFYIQVIDVSYKISANSNVLRRVINYPARGLIYDRNGKLLVFNQAAYDVLVIPKELKPFDTLSFCNTVGIEKEELVTEIKKAKLYSKFKPTPVVKQLSSQRYAMLQEHLFRYPGFYTQARTIRQYPENIASHVIGYVGEADQRVIDSNHYYESGDYIGITGMESAYEEYLRGVKGISYMMVDVHNRIKGSFEKGKLDTTAVIGKNLISSLNKDLQSYGERLLRGKIGSIIAIEPSTGEILMMASSPSFDPSMFVGREGSKNRIKLMFDPLKPMLNRAASSSYPPGSTFKLANALAGLEDGALNEFMRFSCAGTASTPIKCTHSHESPLSLVPAIRESCNSYFYQAFRAEINHFATPAEGLNSFRNHLLEMGIGKKVGADIFNEKSGNVPSVSYYDKMYGQGHWNAVTIRSLSIGQGELLLTPVQLANLACIIANRGYYIAPHLVKSIEDIDRSQKVLQFEKHTLKADRGKFDLMAEGMEQVVESGTARAAAKVDSLVICGKTGTIQNPHGEAHSAFIAFAPKENPQIAIAVYIEQGVWGARYAAPIASLIIEKYIKNKISKRRLPLEESMLNSDLISTMHIEVGD